MIKFLAIASCLLAMPILGQTNVNNKPVKAAVQPLKRFPMPGGCMDQFAQVSYCPIWKQMGYCASHAPLMRPYCSKTCGFCRKPLPRGAQPLHRPANVVKPVLDLGPVKQFNAAQTHPNVPIHHPVIHAPGHVAARPLQHHHGIRHPSPAQAKLHLQQLIHKHPRINKKVNGAPIAAAANGNVPVAVMGNMTSDDHYSLDSQGGSQEDPQAGNKGQGPVHMPPPLADQVSEEDYVDTTTYDDEKLDGEPESGLPTQKGGDMSHGKEDEHTEVHHSTEDNEFQHSTEGTGDHKALSITTSGKESDDNNKSAWWKGMSDKYEHLVHDLQKELEDEREQYRERLEEKQTRIYQLEEMVQQQKAASSMINQDKMADSQAMKPDEAGRPRLNMAPWQAPLEGNAIPNIDSLPFARTKTDNFEKSVGEVLEPFGLDPKVSIGKQAMFDARDGLGDPSQFIASWSEEMGTGKSDIQKKKKKKGKRLSKGKYKASHKRS